MGLITGDEKRLDQNMDGPDSFDKNTCGCLTLHSSLTRTKPPPVQTKRTRSLLCLPSSSQPLRLHMTQTETPFPPLITWSLTGKRGRRSPQPRRTHHEPESQERDIARFLLALSSPSPASDHGGGEEAVEDGEGSGSDGSGRRKRRRRVTTRVRVHECSLCPKRFRTGQALGGHMKSHWERDLHGRVVKKKTRKLSSLLGLGLGLGFGLELDVPSPSPPNPNSPGFSLEGRERDQEYGGESLAEEDSLSSPPARLPLPC